MAACTDLGNIPVVEGPGEKCPLNLRFVEGGPFTKGDTPLDESLIEDMNLFIFNPDKLLLYSKYFHNDSISFEDVLLFTNMKYTIYAVANWGEELDCTTVQELESLVFKGEDMAVLQNGKGGRLLSGKLENVNLSVGAPLDMGLSRLLGKIRLVCDFSRVNSNTKLTVKKVSLKNVPVEGALFKTNVATQVVGGGTLQGGELSGISTQGVEFYMFENVQGEVASGNGNKGKANLLDEHRRSVSSYIEMECDLVSKAKKGTIIYRFYLGTDTDCNVYRNVQQNVCVCFVGDVSQLENSISVDNSALLDRVTQLWVYPALISYAPGNIGAVHQCGVDVIPETAYDKSVLWYTSNKKVATVDQTGLITTKGVGRCEIWVVSNENTSVRERVIVIVN